MYSKQQIGIVDYLVIFSSLLISAGIGILLKMYAFRDNSLTNYLMAGKNMSQLPVIFSIIVTMTSPVGLLSAPMELYRYGIQYFTLHLSIPIGMALASYVIIPVYFQCEISTVNEFLEMRYGKIIRTIISVIMFLQMLVYMSVALFGSVLALSAVTDLSMEMSVISLGIICAFYCSLGGLKAVLWTDVYQFLLICIYTVVVYSAAVPEGGGMTQIFQRFQEDGKMKFFDVQLDFFRRFTFLSGIFKGIIYSFAMYGTNQIEVQRLLCLSNGKTAQSTMLISALPVSFTYIFTTAIGILMYSVFYHCDPILNSAETGLSKYDQVIPYYIVTRLSSIPGLTGLCVAGIFSSSLSTVSSGLNSVTTITIHDFIKPLTSGTKYQLSDERTVTVAKILSALYGGICIPLSFVFLELGSLVQIMYSAFNMSEGAMLAVFLFGVLTTKASDKVVSISFVLSYVLMGWISLGSMYTKKVDPTFPLRTSQCNTNYSSLYMNSSAMIRYSDNYTTVDDSELLSKDSFILFRISFMWHSLLGFILSAFLITIGILFSGWGNDVISTNSKCLSPITKLWMKESETTSRETVSQKEADVVASE